MPSNVAALRLPWYRTLGREQWRVLVASDLGWAFDGFEIYALFLTVGFALDQLLVPTQYQAIPRYVGYVLATTVFGWATGGVLGGIIADYIGRKRTMMLAILAYSLTTAAAGAAAQRGRARGRRRGADPLHGRRHVPRPERPVAARRGSGTGSDLRILRVTSSVSASARNGSPAPRSSRKSGRTTRAAGAAACCNRVSASAASSPRASGS